MNSPGLENSDGGYKPLTVKGLRDKVESPGLRAFFGAIPFLSKILKLDEVNEIFENCEGPKDMDFVDKIFDYVDIHADINPEDLAKIPKEGGFIAMITHHMGITDGVAVEAIAKVRRNIRILGMGFVSELTGNINNMLIKVEKMGKRSDENRAEIRRKSVEALKNGNALILMGSGTGASKIIDGHPVDKPWKEGGPRFAIEQMMKQGEKGFPILPIHVGGKNDWWYYLLRSIAKPVTMPLYIRQFLKRKGEKFPVKIGELLTPEFLCEEFAARLKKIKIENRGITEKAAEKLAYKSIAQLIRSKAYEAAGIKNF